MAVGRGKVRSASSVAADLANLNVDIIVAGGTPAALVTRKTTVTIAMCWDATG